MKRYPIQSKGVNLFFEVNLIGYKNTGESIVLSVRNENEDVLWCGIIDCFKYKKQNKTKTILNSYGYGKDNKKLDFLCISHPDLDHIRSINEIIEEITDDNTMILMPNFIDSHINKTREIVAIRKQLENKFQKVYPRTSVPDNLFFNRQHSLTNLRWEFVSGTKKYNMQIESLTPQDSIMLNSINMKYQQFKNDFSICLRISFNDQYFLFMGDCTDAVLSNLDEEYIPSDISYLKIPHHGCRNETMMSYIDNQIVENINVCGCSYRKKTTLKETLNFYSKISDFVSVTGNIDANKNIHVYGYLKHTYNIETGELIREKCFAKGNAIFDYGKLE